MRVMFAVPSYWPSQDGVANITGYLAEGLAELGHEILVYTSSGNGGLQELPEREVHKNVSIERIRVYVRWPLCLRGRDSESTAKKYFKRIRSYSPDVLIVVCSQTWTFDWLRPYLGKIHCPKVFYSHGYSKWLEKYDYKERLLKRNILGMWEQYKCKKYYERFYLYVKKYDLAIYLSAQNNAWQYAALHDLSNGKILENAIDDVFFQPEMRHQYVKAPAASIKFLFVANYSENKNHEMLIRAYKKANIGESQLIFVGFEENAYFDFLKRLTIDLFQEEHKKQVLFHIHLDREKVVKLYQEADVFVCSSKSETWSIVAHEAAATAMPIISTKVGVYEEISGAVLVDDEEDMKNALEMLYNNPEERKIRGEAAYQWLCTKSCRIKDKVIWLEKSLEQLL